MSGRMPGPDPRPGRPVERSVPVAVGRGTRGRCPACGTGRLFGRFLKVAPACTACGTAFSGHRADDFPPYIVMFLVGHVVGYGIYVSEVRFGGLDGAAILVWPAAALVLCCLLLQPVKGAVVGLQYALRMHGFGHGTGGLDGGDDNQPRRGGPAEPPREAQA